MDFFESFFFSLHWVFVAALRLSLVVASGDYSPVAMLGLLISVASLFVEHRLYGVWASVVAALRLSCSMTCGIFLDQGWNPCPLHWRTLTHCAPREVLRTPVLILLTKVASSSLCFPCVTGTLSH